MSTLHKNLPMKTFYNKVFFIQTKMNNPFQAALLTLATISFLCPLAMVMRKPMNLITALYMTTLITVVLVSGTKLGNDIFFSKSGI